MDFRSGLRSLPPERHAGSLPHRGRRGSSRCARESRFVQDEAVDGLNHHDPAAGGIVVTKAAALHGSVRKLRGVKWQRAATVYGPGDTWADFVRSSGSQWQSAWDRATNTPLRGVGRGHGRAGVDGVRGGRRVVRARRPGGSPGAVGAGRHTRRFSPGLEPQRRRPALGRLRPDLPGHGRLGRAGQLPLQERSPLRDRVRGDPAHHAVGAAAARAPVRASAAAAGGVAALGPWAASGGADPHAR
jgi:hypothetical protein